MDNWNEDMDLESILLEYGGEEEPPAAEPEESTMPAENRSDPVTDFDAFNAATQAEDDVRVYSPTASAKAEDEDGVRIYTPGEGTAKKSEPEENVKIDPRFRMGYERRHEKLSFAGQQVDQSADDNYAPPLPHDAEFVSAYTGENSTDDYPEEPKEKGVGGFFKRAVKWIDDASLGKQKMSKRRLNKQDAYTAAATAYDLDEDEYERRANAYDAAEAAKKEKSSANPVRYYERSYPQPQYAAENEPSGVDGQYEDDMPDSPDAQSYTAPQTEYIPEPEPEPWVEPELDFSKYEVSEADDIQEREDEPEPESRSPYEFDSVNAFDPAGAYRTDDDSAGFMDFDLGDNYDEDIDYERPESEFREKEDFFPSSFKEYVFSVITSLLYRLRGSKGSSRTMQEEQEDLGKEVEPLAASKYYGDFTESLRKRLRVSLILLVIMIWITVGLPVPGMLKDYKCASAAVLAMQLTVSLLALDVVTAGIMNLVRGKPGAETLAVFSCFLTGADALVVSLADISSPHVALCCISSLSLVGILASSLISCRGMRKSMRVPAIGRRVYTVTGEMDVKKHEITLLKSLRRFGGFVHRAEEAPPDEDAFRTAAMPLMFGTLLLAIIVAAVKKSFGDLIFIYSAIFAPGVPAAALLCFALPFLLGSLQIFSSGAAIAGWSGLNDIGRSKNLIVTDRDLFPDGSAELENVRFFEDAERVISYAGSMMLEAGCSVSPAFGRLMEENHISTCRIGDLEYLSGGGMKAIIDGSVVLCGGKELMRLMNIRVPFGLVGENPVLLAIDGKLYGIFNVKYTAQPQVRKALIELIGSDRHPIFAIRDFNISPAMLAKAFDVATDGYDFPPYVERFKISAAAPGEDSQIAAVICREGLGPLTHMAETGRKMYVAVRINLGITLGSALLGVLLSFIKLLTAGTVGPVFLLVYMLLCAAIVAAVSVYKGLN